MVIQTASGLGSGVIVDTQGNIVTNAHVVGESSVFRVYLATGKSYDGKLIGAFVPDDLAVIRISAPDLRPAVFGDSDHLRVGSIVMAVGSPLGLQSSVTEGIVSALGRQVTEPNGVALPPLIQTSADINPGNSGGALVDLNGEVIGIPTLAAQDPQAGGTAPGIGFAIPSNVAKDIAAQLIQNGRVTNSHRAYLGVQGASLPKRKWCLHLRGGFRWASGQGWAQDRRRRHRDRGAPNTRPAEYGFGTVRPPARAVQSRSRSTPVRRFSGFALCDPRRTAGLEALQLVGAMRWRSPLLAWFPESGSRGVAAGSRP